jgi:hypothetical protein
MGTPNAPDGTSITVDSESLELNGRPWTPVMGEFHYARYPHAEWREELLKMKAGGISIVSTYVFWIYHEEEEGKWDWSGDRDLRDFVRIAGEVGLKVIVRCGPWCHGEVRNGGFPEWLVHKDWKLRSVDPRFLEKVRVLYGQIAAQIRGELWKDGGPVIGIQLDNEYEGPADYLVALKEIARAQGLDVPLYTRTGWTRVTTPMPFGEIVPLYGVYAEGFWSRELTSMPGIFWDGFRFSSLRFEGNIATEQMGHRDVRDAPDVALYPYLTCEIGGGMMSSYHRRILINPEDVESTTLVKLGSGSTLPGYYMYHGGINPEGRDTTMMEQQDTVMTNFNDLPTRNYDFQAPLGAFGQIRPQYHLLRRLHLFLADFGEGFAHMGEALPDVLPGPRGDSTTLRWAVRSNGMSGYVFVNNYERGLAMPVQRGVQFKLSLPAGPLVFPATPVDVPCGSAFFWPFNLDLGHGVRLAYATAQPVCTIEADGDRAVFFAQTEGVPAVFKVEGEPSARTAAAGHGTAFRIPGNDGKSVSVVVLDDLDSLALWKGSFQGKEHVFLTRAGLILDGKSLRLTSSVPSKLTVGIYPAPTGLSGGSQDGIFTRFAPDAPAHVEFPVSSEKLREAGPAREIPLGKISQPVATEPGDADFSKAAVWRIKIPAGVDLGNDPLLRFLYVGDVARVTLNGRLLVDDFYNGRALEIGLRRYAPQILSGDLEISILPLREDALEGPKKRIFMAESARPDFGGASQAASLGITEIISRYTVQLSAGR